MRRAEFSRGYFEIAKEQRLQTVAIAGTDFEFAKKATDGARENATGMGFINEWKNPRIFWVQYQGVKGNGLEQFKKLGTQVIVYPEELASGELEFPYSERR